MDPIHRSQSRHAKVTALEILFVVTLFAMIAGAAIYWFRAVNISEPHNRPESDLANIVAHLQMYQTFNECLPSTEQGLRALAVRPVGEPQPRNWRRLLPEIPVDP